jgi:hypothetical protein
MCPLVYCAVRFACVQPLLLLLVLHLLLQAALGLYYMHIGESGGAGGQGVTIGEAWDSWSWLQVGLCDIVSLQPTLKDCCYF